MSHAGHSALSPRAGMGQRRAAVATQEAANHQKNTSAVHEIRTDPSLPFQFLVLG
jgi:hypothetical protein